MASPPTPLPRVLVLGSNGRLARRLTCACGIEDAACMVESQIDGDCSAHDARLAAKPTGCWGVGMDGERAWEVGERYEQHAYPEDDEDERARMAFGGAL